MTSKNLLRPTSKGQVTIPKSFRQKLNLDSDTFLKATLEGQKIIFQPVTINPTNIRTYTDLQIKEFMKEDKLTEEDAIFLNRILNTNKY